MKFAIILLVAIFASAANARWEQTTRMPNPLANMNLQDLMNFLKTFGPPRWGPPQRSSESGSYEETTRPGRRPGPFSQTRRPFFGWPQTQGPRQSTPQFYQHSTFVPIATRTPNPNPPTRGPGFTTQGPAFTTRGPAFTTQGPAFTTQGPVFTSTAA